MDVPCRYEATTHRKANGYEYPNLPQSTIGMPCGAYDDVRHNTLGTGHQGVVRMSSDRVSSVFMHHNISLAGAMLRADRADRLTVVAIVVVPVHVVRIEVEVPRVVRVVLVERRRPIVAVVADIVEIRVVAIARSGKKTLLLSAVA